MLSGSRIVMVLLAAMMLAGWGCAGPAPLRRFESKRVCMGVQTRIVVYALDSDAAERAAGAAFDRIGQLDEVMSDYRATSELMRLGAEAGGAPVAVSPELFEILRISERVSRASDGAFDITVGPVVGLWRDMRRTGRLAPETELDAARGLVDWRNVRLDEAARTARLMKPGMKLDLGGIAKGYAAQQAVELLKSRGMSHCLVALAGDIVVGEAPPGKLGWDVEVAGEQGAEPGAEKPMRLVLTNSAVSTSGDTEQFIEIDGRRYSHIVDPRTGVGILGGLSVTVVAARGELADALPTAACVMGSEWTIERVRSQEGVWAGTAAILEERTGAGVVLRVIDPGHRLRWAGGEPVLARSRVELPER